MAAQRIWSFGQFEERYNLARKFLLRLTKS